MSIKKFQPYIDPNVAETGLKNGHYVLGLLRVNSSSPNDAFCVIEGDETRDILIKGKENRNRAFNKFIII